MTSSSLAVYCKEIKKTYGLTNSQIAALRGINLEVYSGELMMVAGPSGCGKTTLISIIAGILNQTSGTCRVYDQELSQMRANEKILFRAKNIGFVFQAFNLLPSLTASENVSIPLIIGGMDRKEAAEKGFELLIKMGMEDRALAFPSALSGGQQQRVAIARALIHNPRLIICDEPTSALDGETGQKIMEIMKDMTKGTDKTFVVVTHDSRIFHFADRIAQMEDGRVIKVLDSFKELKEYSKK